MQWVNPVRENAFFQEYTWDHALAMWKPNWGPKPSAFVAQPSASMPTPQVRACWRPIKGVLCLHMPTHGGRTGSSWCQSPQPGVPTAGSCGTALQQSKGSR